MRNRLEPMPEGDARDELEQAARAIDGKKDLGDPIAGEKLVRALPERVNDYRADGPALPGSTPAELGTATTAARRYRTGKSVMHVKFTDTADAPVLRRELAAVLTKLGNEPTGNQKGRLERDVPGVIAYHGHAQASRAMALVGDRFLVEVMVEQTDQEDVAWTAIGALDRKKLAR